MPILAILFTKGMAQARKAKEVGPQSQEGQLWAAMGFGMRDVMGWFYN